jgi:anaerobic selenocysteine-containing dehydrogenase
MPTVLQSCPLDCPDACSLEVSVENDRVTKVDGDWRNPVTAGFICGKVRRMPAYLYGPDRVMYPCVRRAGSAKGVGGPEVFQRVSWEDALDIVAAGLESARTSFGGEAILPACYGGSNGYLTHGVVDQRLWRRLGATKLLHTICAAPSGAAQALTYGKMPGVAFQDYVHAELIVLWGVNPSATGIHLVPFIRQAVAAGAKLVVLDPRRIQLARSADLHIALKPGTDLPVALSLANWLFENCEDDADFLADHARGVDEFRARAARWPLARAAEVAGVDPGALETLARWYAAASPAVIRCGWGLERNRNGASAVASVIALPAVAGKFAVRGGGYTMSNTGAWRLSTEPAIGAPESGARSVNMNQLGRALTEISDPPVKALFVYNGNPASTFPDQERVRRGMRREDLFTVVHEQIWTDTCRYADVVLPATSFLEHDELHRGYGSYVLQRSGVAAAAPGEAKSNFQVFLALCDRLGLAEEGDLRDPECAAKTIVMADPEGPRLWAELSERGGAVPQFGNAPVQFLDVFPATDDGKVHLFDAAADREAPEGLFGFRADPATPQHPLALITPASVDRITATFGNVRERQARVRLAPCDAALRDIATGAAVVVFNELGEVRCVAEVSGDVRGGVVEMHKGVWDRETASGNSPNALCPDTLSDLGGGACFNDARVDVALLGPS